MARQVKLDHIIIPTPKEGSIIEYYTQTDDGSIIHNVKKADGSVQIISAVDSDVVADDDNLDSFGVVGAILRGAWKESVTYIVNDIVTYDSSMYVCTKENINIPPASSASSNGGCWLLYVAKGKDAISNALKGIWDISYIYSIGDIVSYNGELYSCTIASNIGNQPGTNNNAWLRIVDKGAVGEKGETGHGLKIDTTCFHDELEEVLATNENKTEGFTVFDVTTGEIYVRVKLPAEINGSLYTWSAPISIKGPEGPQGQPGPQGPAPTIVVDNVFTSESGANAIVTATQGADGKTYMSFTLPRGDKGAPFTIDKIGYRDELSMYDNAVVGFSFYAEDTGDLYIKKSIGIADWCEPMHIAGPPIKVLIGNVTTVSSTAPAKVSVHQNGATITLDFEIPKGVKGDTGMSGTFMDGLKGGLILG